MMDRFSQLKDAIVMVLAVIPASENTLRLSVGPEWAVPYALEALVREGRIKRRGNSALYHLAVRSKHG